LCPSDGYTDDTRRAWEQLSGAEVPGFHVRTQADDLIGKLYALRVQLVTPIPEGLSALLDDADELVEAAISLALDNEAEPVTDYAYACIPDGTPPNVRRYGGGALGASGSNVLYHCSCGAPTISDQ
jgi:hypothetical protein